MRNSGVAAVVMLAVLFAAGVVSRRAGSCPSVGG